MTEILFDKIAHLIHNGMILVSSFLSTRTSFYLFLIVVAVFFAAVVYYFYIV